MPRPVLLTVDDDSDVLRSVERDLRGRYAEKNRILAADLAWIPVALAAERFESDLKADRDLVELRLSLGATARQAATPALRSSISAGLSPIINNMMIAGIVAIPGMTTGQLLAGADVGEAIRYQILIYLGIGATVTLSVLILLAIRLRRYFTPAHQLRREALDG